MNFFKKLYFQVKTMHFTSETFVNEMNSSKSLKIYIISMRLCKYSIKNISFYTATMTIESKSLFIAANTT